MSDFKKLFNTLANRSKTAVVSDTFTNLGLVGTQIAGGVAAQDNFGGVGAVNQDSELVVSQNVREQVPPRTTNKVPRVYGNVTTGGVIIDAQLSNSGNTLNYAMVLSEFNPDADLYPDPDGWSVNPDPGTGEYTWDDVNYDYLNGWTVHDVYRNDQKCVFKTITSPLRNEVVRLENIDDPTTNVTLANNNIRVNVYAGSSSNTSQIFPSFTVKGVNEVNAYDIMPGWTSSNTMDDLVFAIVSVDFGEAESIEELGEFSFTISNDALPERQVRLDFPARALWDYLTNTRYGLGVDPSVIDFTRANVATMSGDTFSDWIEYSRENITVYDTRSGTNLVELDRHRVDGVVNTQQRGIQNIQKITQAGNGYLRFNHKTNKWAAVVNRDIDDDTIAAAFSFNEDNIISAINIGSTDLYSLFNSVEFNFPNYRIQDRTESVAIITPVDERQPNEPENSLNVDYSCVTNRGRAGTLAWVDLKQSRSAQTISFTADFSALGVDVGDLVLVTVPAYGFVDEYFRVLRTTEQESEDGALTISFVCRRLSRLMFREGIFEDTFNNESGTNYLDPPANKDAAVTIEEICIADPVGDVANVYYANGTLKTSKDVSTASVIYTGSEAGTDQSWISFKLDFSGDTSFDTAVVSSTHPTIRPYPAHTEDADTPFGLSPPVYVWHELKKLATGEDYEFAAQLIDDNEYGFTSNIALSSAITVTDTLVNGNLAIDTYGAKTAVEQTIGSLANVSTIPNYYYDLHPPMVHDVVQMERGEYEISITATPTLTSAETFDTIALTAQVDVTFVNTTNSTVVVNSFGMEGGIPPTTLSNTEIYNSIIDVPVTFTGTFNTDPILYGLDQTGWYASRANVLFRGYSTGVGPGFDDVSYEFYRRTPIDRRINPGWYPEE